MEYLFEIYRLISRYLHNIISFKSIGINSNSEIDFSMSFVHYSKEVPKFGNTVLLVFVNADFKLVNCHKTYLKLNSLSIYLLLSLSLSFFICP